MDDCRAGCPDPVSAGKRLRLGDGRLGSLPAVRRAGDRVRAAPARERLELQFTTRQILPQAETSGGHIAVKLDDCAVRFRLPLVGDLANLSAFTTDAARNELLAACFLDGQRAGITLAFEEVSEAVRAAVEEEMARQDPYAHTELALDCPACGQAWNQPFDAASFLGMELEAWARRTLYEVHVLASAYGWTESEILQLSPARRQLYLSLFGT